MSGATYICVTDDECPRHGKFIYHCFKCHEEWKEKNPHTARALSNPGVDRNSLRIARRKDQEARAVFD